MPTPTPTLPDLHAWLERSRRNGPAHYDEKERCCTVLGHPETLAVLADAATFSSDLGDLMPRQEDLDLFQRGNFVRMDPPRHDTLRRLVSQAFTPRMVAGLEPRIAEVTNGLLDDRAGERRFDLIEDLAYPLPVIVIAELLGIPATDRPLFRSWADRLFDRSDAGPDESLSRLTSTKAVAEVAPAVREMNAYLLGHIRARRAAPGGDLISRLVVAEAGGEHLSDEEIVGFAGLLLLAGHITTTATLGNTVLCLDAHPDAAAEVRADPALLPSTIEEVVRLYTPFPRLVRRATADATVGGTAVPAGAVIVTWLAAANRDERVFADPARFDPRRTPNPHLGFGHGLHFCLGAPLARLEARIAMEILLRRYGEIAVDAAEPAEFRNPWIMVSPTRLPLAVAGAGR
ncbi:cytochrome P450 [Dactylosporangium sp. NPDC048998]|uniref:cytochrome P450 n=1 Tax=Dactylosporangium sp. NPDC048998 TaxID=3363976 RepID=UPI00371808AD